MPLAFEVNENPDIEVIKRALDRFDKELDIESKTVQAGLRRMAKPALDEASRITHRDTATLWQSYLIHQDVGTSGAFATIFVDPTVVNPRGQRPANYAFYEFARGGAHDAFGRTMARAAAFVEPGVDYIVKEAAKKAKV